MLAKSWEKICLVILVVACLCSIISKLNRVVSYKTVVNTIQTKQDSEVNTKRK